MQLSTRLLVILTCIVAAAAIPLGLEVEQEDNVVTPPLSSQLQLATDDVNKQIPKMLKTLTDAGNGDADAVDRVKLAFGPQGVAHISKIKKNIQKIDAGTMVVSNKSPSQITKDRKGQINAYTPFLDHRPSGSHRLTTLPVEFGNLFYGMPKTKKTRKARASTVLHEAAHVFAYASDDHYTTGKKKMVPFGVGLTDKQRASVKEQGGYANVDPVVGSPGNPITDADLHADFKELRDSSPNMHINADSYALFGAVCDEQMARRRKRALMEDNPVDYYLAKRGAASCKLPPNYFKNKAAAKAAKEKTASKSSTASKAGLAKTTNKNPAGVRSGSQKTIKGGKPLAVSKSPLKALGKATKFTVTKTSKSGLSKGTLKESRVKVPTSKTSKASSREKVSNSKTSKPSSKAAKGALKGSMSKGLKPEASKAKTSESKTSKSLSKSSKSTRAKSVNANASRASSKEAVKSKASRPGSSMAVPKRGTKSNVSAASEKVAKPRSKPAANPAKPAAFSKKKNGKA